MLCCLSCLPSPTHTSIKEGAFGRPQMGWAVSDKGAGRSTDRARGDILLAGWLPSLELCPKASNSQKHVGLGHEPLSTGLVYWARENWIPRVFGFALNWNMVFFSF